MSDPDETRGEPPQHGRTTPNAPPLAPVLRYYGPWALTALLVAGAAWGHLRLAARVDSLEERLAARDTALVAATAAGPAVGPARNAVPGDAPAGRAPATAAASAPPVTQVRDTAPPTWSCEAQLDAGAVRAVIGREGRAVLACIEARRAAVPTLAGRLDVRLRVGGAGAVEAVHVGGVQDDALIGCVGRAALRWTFPAPGAGRCAVVAAPFVVGP